MANNEIKTNAEIYREQRKERLAKAAKKKKSSKSDKIIRILVKVVCIVLVVGVVLYGLGSILTNVFCVPQKTLTVAKYGDNKITVAEYNYYYMSLYNQILQTAQQIDSYYGTGYGAYYTGFDYSKDPATQEYVGSDAPEGVETWSDYFRLFAAEKAIIQSEIYKEATSDAAKSAGFHMSDEDTQAMNDEINEVLETLAGYAESQDYSLNNYISKTCGEGLTEKKYVELMKRDYIVQSYLEWYQEDLAASVSETDVNAYYNEHKADFDYATVRLFSVSYAEVEEDTETEDPIYTKEEAKALADDFLSKVKDEATFKTQALANALPSDEDAFEDDSATLAANILKSTVESTSKALAEWIFADGRVAGDKAVIDDTENELYYIAYVVSPAAPDTQTAGADVRHILVSAETTKEDDEGNEVDLSQDEIDKNFAEAKTEAERILKEWQDGDATEESFVALCASETDDTASASTGGLYEDITSTSSYVPEFLDWALADHEVGDTEIIKTDYGYHIMYYVGADEEQKWESDVRTTIADEKFTEYSDALYEKVSKAIDKNETLIDYFVKACEELITNSLSYSSSSSSSSITY